MDDYAELRKRLESLGGRGNMITIWQGIVKSVGSVTCDVAVGNIVVPVRMKASEKQDEDAMLVVPAVGSAVTIGSLSGDLTELVILQVDRVEKVVINGGKLGGLINIEALTSKLNALVSTFNTHTHPVPNGVSSVTTQSAAQFTSADYEDKNIKH